MASSRDRLVGLISDSRRARSQADQAGECRLQKLAYRCAIDMSSYGGERLAQPLPTAVTSL